MARTKYVNPYNSIEWIPLDNKYCTTYNGGNIPVNVLYGFTQLIFENADNVITAAIKNLIYLSFSFSISDEVQYTHKFIEHALENFDKTETGTFEELSRKRKAIENGSKCSELFNAYVEEIEEAKTATISNIIQNLRLDYEHKCFPNLIYHCRDEVAIMDQMKNLCLDVRYLDPTKFSDSDEHDSDEDPWVYSNLMDYFTTKISFIV